jgi:RNA polymerase sigma factor (sigma-70 family)
MREEDQLASFQRLEEVRQEFLVRAFSVPRLLVQHRDFLSDLVRNCRHGDITLRAYLEHFKEYSLESLRETCQQLDHAMLELGDGVIAATLKANEETISSRDIAIRKAANIAATVLPIHVTRLIRETRAPGTAVDGGANAGDQILGAYCSELPKKLHKQAQGLCESLQQLLAKPESATDCCKQVESFLKGAEFQSLLHGRVSNLRNASQQAQLYIVGRLLCAAAAVPAGGRESLNSESTAAVAPSRAVFEELREEAILKNWPLVIVMRKRFGGGIPNAEALSAGLVGLCKAVDRYSTARGAQFSTFACWEIRGQISRERSLNARRRSSVSLERQTLDVVDPRLCRGANISCRLGESDEQGLVAASFPTRLRNILPASGQTAEEAAGANELSKGLRELVAKLPQRQATALRLRYGLGDGEERTLESVGKQLGVTREYVRQLEMKAVRRSYPLAISSGLDEFLE